MLDPVPRGGWATRVFLFGEQPKFNGSFIGNGEIVAHA